MMDNGTGLEYHVMELPCGGYIISETYEVPQSVDGVLYSFKYYADYNAKLLSDGPYCWQCGNQQEGILQLFMHEQLTSLFFPACLACAFGADYDAAWLYFFYGRKLLCRADQDSYEHVDIRSGYVYNAKENK